MSTGFKVCLEAIIELTIVLFLLFLMIYITFLFVMFIRRKFFKQKNLSDLKEDVDILDSAFDGMELDMEKLYVMMAKMQEKMDMMNGSKHIATLPGIILQQPKQKRKGGRKPRNILTADGKIKL